MPYLVLVVGLLLTSCGPKRCTNKDWCYTSSPSVAMAIPTPETLGTVGKVPQ